jgi:hypothetical protein
MSTLTIILILVFIVPGVIALANSVIKMMMNEYATEKRIEAQSQTAPEVPKSITENQPNP